MADPPLEGLPDPEDTMFPEDWVGSATPAINPPEQTYAGEGLSTVEVGGREYAIYPPDGLQQVGDSSSLPFSLKILLENLPTLACPVPLIVDGVAYFMGAKKGTAVRLPKTIDGT